MPRSNRWLLSGAKEGNQFFPSLDVIWNKESHFRTRGTKGKTDAGAHPVTTRSHCDSLLCSSASCPGALLLHTNRWLERVQKRLPRSNRWLLSGAKEGNQLFPSLDVTWNKESHFRTRGTKGKIGAGAHPATTRSHCSAIRNTYRCVTRKTYNYPMFLASNLMSFQRKPCDRDFLCFILFYPRINDRNK